jgi:hypothetical protein
MKLLNSQTDESTLANFGAEVAQLVKESKYREIADRFGYALAYGREKAETIQQEVESCLSQGGSKGALSLVAQPRIVVKYFKPNDSNLFAVVECTMALTGRAGEMLVELIVTTKENEKYLSLEQISYAA